MSHRWFWLLLAFAVAAIGCAVLSDITYREKRQARIRAERTAVERVDMGVVLHVVERDPNGQELVAGAPPLRIVRTHRRGRMVDIRTVDGKRVATWGGPSRNPVTWYCSVDQEPLILHPDTAPLWQLIQGSEGSGKTTIIPQWVAFRAFEHLGTDREIGITAPTNKRMAHIKRAIAQHWPASWYRYVDDTKLYTFHAGPRVQLVSAHQQSEAEGSPIQGFNWVAHAGDELQDHFERESDIEARGRSAPGGRYKRLNTSTFKDATSWRDFRATCEKSDAWGVVKLLGLSSPFVDPSHWERLRTGGTMTAREYQRRVLAMDVGPEAQLYHCWKRRIDDRTPGNLRPIPLGATDITAQVLSSWGQRLTLLVGHDPGKRQHVSVFLKAYQFPEDIRRGDTRPRWFVVDEVTSPDATVNSHAQEVLKRATERWGCYGRDWKGRLSESATQMLVRIDPHTRSGDEHPGKDVYAIWRNLGILARAAAYTPNSTTPATIKRESRIDMVNTLLCASGATGDLRRLFVATDESGTNWAAKKLVEAFESMERNDAGEAERERKDASDRSHWPAAVGYALWQIEAPRLGMVAA